MRMGYDWGLMRARQALLTLAFAGLLLAGPASARPEAAGLDVLLPPRPAPPQTFLVQLHGPPPRPLVGAAGPELRRRATVRLLDEGAKRLSALSPVIERLRAGGQLQSVESFPAFGILAVTGGAEALRVLAELPEVREILPNRQHRLAGLSPDSAASAMGSVAAGDSNADLVPALPTGLAQAPAPAAWQLRAIQADNAWARFGSRGEGATIAFLDTGVDWLHPMLAPRYRGRYAREHDYHWLDATAEPGAGRPSDGHGHGSHVAGLALGVDASGPWGSAPAAEWIAAKVFDASGQSSDLWLLRGAAWAMAPTRLDGSAPRADLAPDVINCSWSLDNGADPLMDAVIDAWLAAGILPVFAAGNVEDESDRWRRVLAPAARSGVLAVGAATAAGRAWDYSRSGPGFEDWLKPDLLAPGLELRSATPGGGTVLRSGSSMAAPQVAGAAAVLRSIEPALGVEAVMEILRRTAQDRGPPGPDPLHGHGLLDLESASLAAATAALVSGRVRDSEGLPAASVLIEALREGPAPAGLPAFQRLETGTDADGRFGLALPAGAWRLHAQDLGIPGPDLPLSLNAGEQRETQLFLSAPRGLRLTGRVVDVEGAALAGARIYLSGEASARVRTGPDGSYSLQLPEGAWTLRAEAETKRAVTASLQILPGPDLHQDFQLPQAPEILLVDADAWDGERIGAYLSRALDDAGYRHTLQSISSPALLPATDGLAAPEILIWAHVYGSPGLIDQRRAALGLEPAVVAALERFVAGGGGLILSGQDVSLHDARRGLAPGFFAQTLGAALLSDRNLLDPTGLQGRLQFDGLKLDLAWPRAAPKLRYFGPDVLAPAAGEGAEAILRYADGTAAALARSDARGRRIFLGFGPESAGGRADLAALYDRALAWLETPRLLASARPALLAPGETSRLDLQLIADRSGAEVSLEVELPPQLRLIDPGDFALLSPGRLRWSGRLEAGDRRSLGLEIALNGPLPGGQSIPIGLEWISEGRPKQRILDIHPLAPDLDASVLGVEPGRLDAPGIARLSLSLANRGSAAAASVRANLALPEGSRALTESLSVETGDALWSPDARVLDWHGFLEAGASTALELDVRVGSGWSGGPFQALLDDGQGRRSTLRAQLRLAGPKLQIGFREPPPTALEAGATVDLKLALQNAGGPAEAARLDLRMPEGLSLEMPPGTLEPDGAWTVWRGALAAGVTIPLDLRLRASDQASRGARDLLLRLDDGLLPSSPVTQSLKLISRRADPSKSRVVLLPRRPIAGGIMTTTILVANHGDAAAEYQVQDTASPGLVPLAGSPRMSVGSLEQLPGLLRWRLPLAPATTAAEWRAAPAGILPEGGMPLAQPAGRPVEVELGLAFPYHTEVYTRAWVSSAGWLSFAPPGDLPLAPGFGAGGLELPGIAAYWRSDLPPFAPRLIRGADRVSIVWHGAGRPVFALELGQDGSRALRYVAGLNRQDATIGSRDAEGRVQAAPEAGPLRAFDYDAPSGWAWLRYQSRVSTVSEPNRVLGHTVLLEGAGHRLSFNPFARVNHLDLSASRLKVWPDRPMVGSRLRYTLTLEATGEVPARDLDARVELPASIRIDRASLPADMTWDDAAGSLRWRGQLPAGGSRDLSWSAGILPDLAAGAAATSGLRLRATGLDELRQKLHLRAMVADFVGSGLWVQRPLAEAGQSLSLRAQVVNRSGLDRAIRARVQLPEGLRLVVGSPRSDQGPPPRWEAATRNLVWEGSVPAASMLVLRFDLVFEGASALDCSLLLEDEAGNRFWDLQRIAPLRAQRYLPTLAR
jgi:subtilisin family serine protease